MSAAEKAEGGDAMKVKDIMTESIVCCTPETRLQAVARQMIQRDCGAIPVLDDQDHNRPLGIITDRDIVIRTVAQGNNPLEMTAGECMTSPAYTVHPEDTVEDCCQMLEEHQVRRALVVDEHGSCCGIVAQADVARHAGARKTAELVEEVSQPA
jgi:CBS domain-containing protein